MLLLTAIHHHTLPYTRKACEIAKNACPGSVRKRNYRESKGRNRGQSLNNRHSFSGGCCNSHFHKEALERRGYVFSPTPFSPNYWNARPMHEAVEVTKAAVNETQRGRNTRGRAEVASHAAIMLFTQFTLVKAKFTWNMQLLLPAPQENHNYRL